MNILTSVESKWNLDRMRAGWIWFWCSHSDGSMIAACIDGPPSLVPLNPTSHSCIHIKTRSTILCIWACVHNGKEKLWLVYQLISVYVNLKKIKCWNLMNKKKFLNCWSMWLYIVTLLHIWTYDVEVQEEENPWKHSLIKDGLNDRLPPWMT